MLAAYVHVELPRPPPDRAHVHRPQPALYLLGLAQRHRPPVLLGIAVVAIPFHDYVALDRDAGVAGELWAQTGALEVRWDWLVEQIEQRGNEIQLADGRANPPRRHARRAHDQRYAYRSFVRHALEQQPVLPHQIAMVAGVDDDGVVGQP